MVIISRSSDFYPDGNRNIDKNITARTVFDTLITETHNGRNHFGLWGSPVDNLIFEKKER